MRITCESCKTCFQVEDCRIPDSGVRLRCSKCNHVFMVRREDPDDLHSGFEAELEDFRRFQTEQKQNEASTGEEATGSSSEEPSCVSEKQPRISFEEFMEKEQGSMEPEQTETQDSEDPNSLELDLPDQNPPEEPVSKETHSQSLLPSEKLKVGGTGETGTFGKKKDRIVLSLLTSVLSGIGGGIIGAFLASLFDLL
jgi:predicted Zn finger-like uncharacterized protein